MAQPRPAQAEVLRYQSGRMGVAAVPGSGKTWTLSELAADLIASSRLADDQEVLIVTLVNSAVDNFYKRVRALLEERQLLPIGYRVRTLHGLCHDIVRERPALVGLTETFQIVDDREAEAIREDAARAWLRGQPYALDDLLDPDASGSKAEWLRREKLPEAVDQIAQTVIRYAKDLQLAPAALREQLQQTALPLPLADLGCAIYADYQRALSYRGAVDFSDLIRLAVQALKTDSLYLERLRARWPYILEDEAQDSSGLQEDLLRRLAGPAGNWVRVGDPNQAIYSTFTTASPKFLRAFLEEPGVAKQALPNSGRSTQSIMDLANELIRWTQTEHPVYEAREALAPPYIEAAPPDDGQPNPPDQPDEIYLGARRLSPAQEIIAVADSLERWLPAHADQTVAVLAPRNQRANELVEELRRRHIPCNDTLLRSTLSTRLSAGALSNILKYLSDPQSAPKLAIVYQVWQRAARADPAAWARVEQAAEWLRKCPRVEEFLWPTAEADWLADTGLAGDDPDQHTALLTFRGLVQRWAGTVLLPIDQAVLTLAQDLFTEPTELAIAHKLAVNIRRASQARQDWKLPELAEEIAAIARNERRFLGFSEDDLGFDPEQYKGVVVVATLHKAKGLEWDRVYLMSVNNYDFPSAQDYDRYISELWYIRDKLNLEAEAVAQVQAARDGAADAYRPGDATLAARLDYVRERLRLLYVGITRARRALVITWNTGREMAQQPPAQPALPLVALQAFWKERRDAAAG